MLRSLRLLLPLLVLPALLLLSGCVARIGPGGAAPGLAYSQTIYPNILNAGMDYQIIFDREDIELLGTVEAQATSAWYFFLVSKGDSGYGRLMDQARETYGADGVMNITIDTRFRNFFIFYGQAQTRLTGMAYRYKRLEGENTAQRALPIVPPIKSAR